MIDFLVEHSQLREEMMDIESRNLTDGNSNLKRVFMILAGKFKKLKKTKEEMTKYCMRKAFKYIADVTRRDRPHSRDLETYMTEFLGDKHEGSFSIPFKYTFPQKGRIPLRKP